MEDGYDTIEWVASEPWCDGNVGMMGGSYVGLTQLHAAVADPPSLKAIAPWLIGRRKERSLNHSLPLESMMVGSNSTLTPNSLNNTVIDATCPPTCDD